MREPPDLGRPIWGLPHIAKVLGVSEATARRWAKLRGVPIYRPAGQGSYIAFSGELNTWLKGEDNATVRKGIQLTASAKSRR